ncbi:MAG: protein-methionine-sulfoxide reductase catalytic subunit MsrP [Chloroflexota bacterium]
MKIKSSEITPKGVYLNRREFMKSTAVLSTSAFLAACGANSAVNVSTDEPSNTEAMNTKTMQDGSQPDELGNSLTSHEAITGYNNFYEFSTDKETVAKISGDFVSSPWQIEVGGLVNNPKTFGIEDLMNNYDQEERIYRLRCVEGWSMVIPWMGFPLSKLLAEVEPTSAAKYVRFQTLLDKNQFPGQSSPWYQWPYTEGLRLDEAMNDLAILSTGLYGEPLLPQNGAPIRMVVPWKYGFKSIKSIVKIDLVDEMPISLWMSAAPNEYGFYSNVNPNVDHPRWSQANERRIGETKRIPTLNYNGYEEQVASLYDGMDLRENF